MRRIKFKKICHGVIGLDSIWYAYDSNDNWKKVGSIVGKMVIGYVAESIDPSITTVHQFKFMARRAIRQRANLPQWTPDPPDDLYAQ